MKEKRLLIIVNQLEFFLSHRLPVALGALNDGYDVHVATGGSAHSDDLKEAGITHHLLPISRSGLNIFSEFRSVWEIKNLLQKLDPDILHLVTIKPVLYGGLVSRVLKVPAVAVAITGLGSAFVSKTLGGKALKSLLRILYRFALGHKNLTAIFQNSDDMSAILDIGAIDSQQCIQIPGSGVRLEDYHFVPESDDTPVVSFAARLIREKGVQQFLDAAEILHSRDVKVRFWLIGCPDPENPTSITSEEFESIKNQAGVEALGFRKDIADLFAKSNIVTLPSYYGEGLPKVLIEAAACGRAVVTTNHPGCRDAIINQETGLLVPTRDSYALADAIECLIKDRDLRLRFGQAGRRLAEEKYSIESVVSMHLQVYQDLLSVDQANGQA